MDACMYLTRGHPQHRADSAAPLPHAWYALRRVSKPIRAATEHVLKSHYLPQLQIKYVLGQALRPGAGLDEDHPDLRLAKDVLSLDVNMKFSHLSTDGARAYFVDDSPPGSERAEELERIGLAEKQSTRWGEMIDKHLALVRRGGYQQLPPHCVVLGFEVCDNPLPEMQLYKEKREVSFLWQPLLDEYLSEIYLVYRLHRTDFPRLTLSNKLGFQQKAMYLVWRTCASNYELNQKPLEVPRGDPGNRWERIVREKRMERWLSRSVGLDHPEGYLWNSQIRRVRGMNKLRTRLFDELYSEDMSEKSSGALGDTGEDLVYFVDDFNEFPSPDDFPEEEFIWKHLVLFR